MPRDELLTRLGCAKDDTGWIVTDRAGRTSVPGIWAAGKSSTRAPSRHRGTDGVGGRLRHQRRPGGGGRPARRRAAPRCECHERVATRNRTALLHPRQRQHTPFSPGKETHPCPLMLRTRWTVSPSRPSPSASCRRSGPS
ncbi:FAD-dependent oxidoreductase [Nonomuraea sp. NPDC049152]|uniref:FAD-dependent oxidoreductase n=1 Tax=Nonomuraea sp. NPDC049152 TaxID=3154350 RepID=UPI0033C106D8